MAETMAPAAGPRELVQRPASYVEWGPIAAGAAAAAATSVLLLTFGSAIGLTAVSPWPNSGLPWWLIGLIAALWILIVQAGSYALGGYLAGRLRAPVSAIPTQEREFRDGAHGFLVWAVGLIVSAIVVGWTVSGAVKTGTEAVSTVAGTATGAAAGALANQADAFAYTVDKLMRATPGQPPAASAADTGAATAPADGDAGTARTEPTSNADKVEVGRIFALSLSNGALAPDDRTYLASLISERTGLPQADAEARVDQAYTALQDAEAKAREAADKARVAAALGAFLTAAAVLIAAVAAAAGAGLGGRHRDENGSLIFLGRERFW
jgi:hypothetical protein